MGKYKIEKIVIETIQKENGSDTVSLKDRLSNDLGMDSFDYVEMIMALEKKLEIKIPDAIAESFYTVEDIVNYIEKTSKI